MNTKKNLLMGGAALAVLLVAAMGFASAQTTNGTLDNATAPTADAPASHAGHVCPHDAQAAADQPASEASDASTNASA